MENRAKNLKSAERRAATVESLVELAARQNPNTITTAAIANYMGVTQGALFRHFSNKEEIWQAAMQWVENHLLASLDKAAADIESPLEAMQAMYLAHIEFVIGHPGVPRIMFGELQGVEQTPAKMITKTIMQTYAKRLRVLIEQGKANGELRADVDYQAAASLFIGTIQGLVMQSLMTGSLEQMRDNAPKVFAIYRKGIEKI